MNLIDSIIFIIYLSGIVIFGSSFYRRNKSSEAFTLGNRKIPTWVISMSVFATFVSSISYLALPGQAYQSDWNYSQCLKGRDNYFKLQLITINSAWVALNLT